MLTQAINDASDDDVKDALTDMSRTIMQLTFTLLLLAAFAMAVVGTPDKQLILTDELMAVPIVGRMPTLVALIIGPILLVFVRAYMQFYINHWRRLDRARGARGLARPIVISPMRDGLLRTGTVIIRYTLVPFAMAAITWKSLGTPGALSFALICATVFVTILHLLQDLPPKWWLWAPAFGIASLGVAAMTEPGQKFLPEAVADMLPAPGEVRRDLNLRYADLSERVLEGRDLRNADMRKAKLMESDLSALSFGLSSDGSLIVATGATNLSGADLSDATLTGADLLGADLTDAILLNATLTDADLRIATLTGAILNGADLTDANLREVKGLSCEQLTAAKNWETAYRDPELACGADIPEPPAED